MIRKMVMEKGVSHPDTYRIECDKCEKLFEANNEDFRYIGSDWLECDCPWCAEVFTVRIRNLQKLKLIYGGSFKVVE